MEPYVAIALHAWSSIMQFSADSDIVGIVREGAVCAWQQIVRVGLQCASTCYPWASDVRTWCALAIAMAVMQFAYVVYTMRRMQQRMERVEEAATSLRHSFRAYRHESQDKLRDLGSRYTAMQVQLRKATAETCDSFSQRSYSTKTDDDTASSRLCGKTIVATGIADKCMLAAIEKYAGRVKTSVSSSTDVLVWGTAKRSGTRNKPYEDAIRAQAMGQRLAVYGLEEFLTEFPEVDATYRQLKAAM